MLLIDRLLLAKYCGDWSHHHSHHGSHRYRPDSHHRESDDRPVLLGPRGQHDPAHFYEDYDYDYDYDSI